MPKKEKIILVWYKKDLRISDHKPLNEAIKKGKIENQKVVAFYSFEPKITQASDFSEFHRQFTEDCINDLNESLQSIGIPFLIFERHISDCIKYILEHYEITHIYSHEETGNSITYQRDILMGKYLKSKNIFWIEYPTNGIVRRLKTRDDWSKIWNKRMIEPIIPIPEGVNMPKIEIYGDMWQKNIGNKNIQQGGEKEGQRVFASFLISRGKGYMGGMSRPIAGQEASSRISPYLTYGCLSLKQVVQMTWGRINHLKNQKDSQFLKSLQAFHSRLHWHSHFIQKLESEPRFEYQNVLKVYDSIRTTYDESIMSAVENAQTGIPFIDGIVRQLKAIGWINFRARATLVSFVCCTCMQPWQGRFSDWLARNFTDYEPGIHYSQLQMQSGTMGIHTIRIYNPTKQLHDKDSDGKFIQTWLKELAHLPKHLQAEPWKISEMESQEYKFILGENYPFPIVDIEEANRNARQILYTIRDQISPGEKSAIVKKHASRKNTLKKKSTKQQNNTQQNLTLFE